MKVRPLMPGELDRAMQEILRCLTRPHGKDVLNAVIDQSQKVAAKPVEAKEPWRPAVGSRVLVEAVVSHDNWHCDTVLVDVGTSINVKVMLSQLRPLPVVQGEGVVK